MDYIRKAFDFYKDTAIEPKDRNEQYFKKFIQHSIICPLVGSLEAREALATGQVTTAIFKESLNHYFQELGKFLDIITEAYPDDKNIQYLQNAYKVVSYKTVIYTGKEAKNSIMHHAFYQLIDTLEALRRASFLSMCTIWTGRSNAVFFNKEQELKYQSKEIVSMKVVNPFIIEPVFENQDNAFLDNYPKFMKLYYKGVESSTDLNIKALNDKLNWLDDAQLEAVQKAIEETSKQVKEGFPPTAEAFADGVVFFTERVTEALGNLYMDCTRGNTYLVPIFKNGLHPYFSYKAKQQEAYLQKLEELKPQRDKNVITILQEAEQDDQDGNILPAFRFFYQALKEALPPETASKELDIITTAVSVITKQPDKVDYPIDKVNNLLWNDIEQIKNGQLAFRTGEDKKGMPVNVIMGINFEELEGVKITKSLSHFDKRVYIAVSALWNAGNEVVTLTQIHYTMGNTNKPAQDQLNKINESITKMMRAWLYLDNAEEIGAKFNYPEVQYHYDAHLLPMERITIAVKGLTDKRKIPIKVSAIHIFREPPLMTFARNRKQITTFEVKLLQGPLRKTDGNLKLEDYLLERIAGATSGALSNTILHDTLFQSLKITGRVQKSRTLQATKKLFEHYKNCGKIEKYVMEPTKITFYFSAKK